MIDKQEPGIAGIFARAAIALLCAVLFASGTNAENLSEYEAQVLSALSAQRTLERMHRISNVVRTDNGVGDGSVVSGSEEERILAAYLTDEFSALGLEIQQDSFPVRAFNYGPVSLEVEGIGFDAVTLHSGGGTWGTIDGIHYSVGNVDNGRALRATLVDAGDGLADDYDRIGDVSGTVVLVRRGPAPGWPSYSITEAAQRGAVAIVFYDYARVPLPDAIRQDSVWYRDMIPAVSISTRSANQIMQKLSVGTATVELQNRVDASFGRSQNVMGIMRGSEFPDEWVLVSGHYDRWFNSDFDNNIGPAVVLELAEILSRRHKPRRSVLFMAYGSEESGTIDTTYDWLAGSYAFVKDHPEISSRLVYAFNIDGAGMSGENGIVMSTADVIPFQQDLVSTLGLQERLRVSPGPTANLDSWTMGAIGGGGVSNVFWFSPPEENGETYGSYYHTQLDVHDDDYYGNLNLDLSLGTLGVLRASSADRIPVSLLGVADWVTERLEADAQKLQEAGLDGDNVFAKTLKANANFRARATAIDADYATAGSVTEIEQLNLFTLRTRRELMPWLYEYGEGVANVRTATPVNDLVAIHQASIAAQAGDSAAAASALEKVGTMGWGMYMSNGGYNTERLLWLEPTGWRSEYEQTPQEVDTAIHAYYLALKNGDTGGEVQQGLSRLEIQARDSLNSALFLVTGKLDTALSGKLRPEQ